MTEQPLNEIKITGQGKIVFSQLVPIKDNRSLVKYIIQYGKGSTVVVKIFYSVPTPILFSKDTIVYFEGLLQENKYKDDDGNWKTTGSEIIASVINDMV